MLKTILQSTPITGVSGAYPQQLLVGDFNGDGIKDFAVPFTRGLGEQLSPILFFLGTGSGQFIDGTTALFGNAIPQAFYAARIVGGDFNNDGKTDVLSLDFGQDAPPFPGGQSELFLSQPGGKMVIATQNLPQYLAQTHGGLVGDINRDGNIDAIQLNLNVYDGRAIEILRGDGTGHFQEKNNLAPNAFQQLGYNAGSTWGALVDLNHDFFPDLVIGTWGATTRPSEVYLNDGQGSFANATPLALPGSGIAFPTVVQVEPMDLNKDGHTDLVLSVTNGGAADTNQFYTVGYLQFLINDGAGHFHDETASRLPQPAAPDGRWFKFVKAIDLNGDGALDLMTDWVSSNGQLTKFFMNDGSGHFAALQATLPGEASAITDAQGKVTSFVMVQGNQLIVIANDLPSFAVPQSLDFVQKAHAGILRLSLLAPEANSDGLRLDLGLSKVAYVDELIEAAQDSTLPALIVFDYIVGHTPDSTHLDHLAEFVHGQIFSPSYQATSYPRLGGFEALGLGLSETAQFSAKFAGGSNIEFITESYHELFGRDATDAQVSHFESQISYFDGLYVGAGISAESAAIRARGAVIGQMTGFAAAESDNPYAHAATAFLKDAADGVANYSIDLIGTYGH